MWVGWVDINILNRTSQHAGLKILLIHSANPKSRPVGIIVLAHVVRTYVRPHFSNVARQNNRKQCSLLVWLWVWLSGSLMTPVLYFGLATKIIKEVLSVENNVKLTWENEKCAHVFPSVWLRDNCQCPECYHPSTKSRRFFTKDLDVDIKPKETFLDGKNKVIFQFSYTLSARTYHYHFRNLRKPKKSSSKNKGSLLARLWGWPSGSRMTHLLYERTRLTHSHSNSDHYFHKCPSVSTFQSQIKQSYIRNKIFKWKYYWYNYRDGRVDHC